ncbi:MAG: hypothetical protein LBP22_04890 [Deltaproteobacteria bacterium]|nr:hypothetical protein [Deltaproteobacteria bacterium]
MTFSANTAWLIFMVHLSDGRSILPESFLRLSGALGAMVDVTEPKVQKSVSVRD